MRDEDFYEWRSDKAEVLAVVLHGWGGNREKMKGITEATRDALAANGGVDVYVPNLPYRRQLSVKRASTILIDLLRDIDKIFETHRNYKRIVLIGHSMGGVLGRRLFLLATGIPPAPDDQPAFRYEEEFTREEAAPRPWAALIDRHVTLGAFNRGWQASERDGWYYSIFFNIMGLLGHLAPKSKWRPTVFDLRVGAPFIVQTRLHWLAYRRWHQALRNRPVEQAEPIPRELLVVQIIGNADDLASPLNQVDLAIERPDSATAPSDRRSFFIEMERSNHKQTIRFDDKEEGPKRRNLFIAALTESPEKLAARASDPTLLVDDLPQIDAHVTDAVFVMHGIRDDGFWTARIAKRVKERAPSARLLKARTPTYGYFAMLPFLLPWIRRQKVEWFMDQYVAARAQYPNARISFVGHSNGTYLAACALTSYAEARFKNIFFAGSVVQRDYPWLSRVKEERVEKIHNVRAARDWVVALLPKSVENWTFIDLGGAGFDGFDDAGKHPSITQPEKFANGTHSAALVESQWSHIADFIIDGKEPRVDPGDDAFVGECSATLKRWAERHLGVYAVLALGLLVGPAIFVGLCYAAFVLLPHVMLGWDISTAGEAVLVTLALVIYVLILKFVITRV